jgi:hypothetical protein
MSYSNLELQNLAYKMVNCGFLEEEDIDPLYRKSNSLNNYINSSSTGQTYNMGERKFNIKDVKSWFKREDYVQYDAYRNYDVAIIKLKHFTGCNIIDEYLFHFYKMWVHHYFTVVKSKSFSPYKDESLLSVSYINYDTEKETDLRNIKADDLSYISFGINLKDVIKLVEELDEDFVYNEIKEVLVTTKDSTDGFSINEDKIEEEIKQILKD